MVKDAQLYAVVKIVFQLNESCTINTRWQSMKLQLSTLMPLSETLDGS